MLKKIVHIIICLIQFLSFSQDVKSITEFRKENDSIFESRKNVFDRSGNLVLEVSYGNYDKISQTYRNHHRIISYENGIKKSATLCEYFVRQDTCVLRSFKNFDYDRKTNTEKIIRFEPDSTVRYIQYRKKAKRIEFVKTFSWEFSPSKNPDYKKAIELTDTIVFDRKGRKIKRKHYRNSSEKPVTEIYKYLNAHYSYQIIGSTRDTIYTNAYTKLQKYVHKKKLEYQSADPKIYTYKIEYY